MDCSVAIGEFRLVFGAQDQRMPSHFSTVGFPLESEQDMYDLANRIGEDADVLEVSEGSYLRWSSSSGAEIWLHVDPDGDLVGMVPHFAGQSGLRVGITSRVVRPKQPALDGAFYAWADPPEDDIEAGLYPFVFDLPDYCSHSNLVLPRLVTTQVAAFAHEIAPYDTVDAFDADQPKEGGLASQSFIPSGLFSPDAGLIEPPEAYAIFTGHVLQAEMKRNELTDRSFWWALVESYGGSFDVVIDPEILEAEPKVGGVVSGSFWLSGRLLEPVVKPA